MSTYDEECLGWLADALRQARKEGQTKVEGYLEVVLEDVVFETEAFAHA